MRFLVQRVKEASVEVNQQLVGKIQKGYLVLIGITHTDTEKEADFLVNKLINLRIFTDENFACFTIYLVWKCITWKQT